MKAHTTSAARISPAMRQLSEYIAGAVHKRLPAVVVERAKLHLVDTVAAIISGHHLLPGKRAVAYARARGGKAEAGIVGTRIVTSATMAALANGMLAHADETDDTHPASRSHPGTCIVPAALAVGEMRSMSGAAVLHAIVLGYDLCARMLFALNVKALRAKGHHPNSFGGTFGAAAAAGILLGLKPRQIRFLLSYAAQQAAGLYSLHRDTEHVEKAFAGAGMPAHNGVASALMVGIGCTGQEDAFLGDRDFLSTFAQRPRAAEVTRGLGRDYEILRSAIKRWPAGGPIQGPLQVLYEMMQQHAFRADDVIGLVIRMPENEIEAVDNRDMPDICIQHLLAVLLLDGTLTHGTAHDFKRMSDRKVLTLRKRMQAVGDASLNDRQRRWRCAMELTLKNGGVLRHRTLAAKGSYENPLSRAEEEDKALGLITPVIGLRRAHRLLTTLWQFDQIKNVRTLRRMWAPA